MSYVTNNGLSYYHSKMKTLLAGKASTNHTHNYAGSSSAGGVANSATKLATARTISSASGSLMTFTVRFDGSSDATATITPKNATLVAENTNNYPWHRILTYEGSNSWDDAMITLFLTGGYRGAPYGMVKITSRIDKDINASTNMANAEWLVRSGYSEDDIYVCIYIGSTKMYVDVFLKCKSSYGSQIMHVLTEGIRSSIYSKFSILDSIEVSNTTASDRKTSKEVYTTIEAAATELRGAAYTKMTPGADNTAVKYAKSTDTANKATQDSGGQQINMTYIKGVSASGTTFTLTKGNGTTSTFTPDCMTNAEIDKLF